MLKFSLYGLLQKKEYSNIKILKNRTIFVSLSELPNGWCMVVKMSKQDVMAQSYELLNMMVMLTLIGMVF